MGRKNRKSKAATATTENDDGTMPKNVKREVTEIVNQLLEICSQPFGGNGQKKEIEEFLEVYQLLEKLRAKQKNFVMHRPKREDKFDKFMEWLKTNEVNTDAVSIEKFEIGGMGLKANKDLDRSSKFLSVPRKIMMTTETAKASVLGPLIEQDRILRAMPNVSLAIHVLCECHNLWSFWEPYLDILPETYTTPLYFSLEEIQMLKGSPVFSDIFNQYRNIARQYAYFYKLFQGNTDSAKLPQRMKAFCYDDYRWAVSTVMTRQNLIPTSDGTKKITALIPMWDMMNHSNGEFTTDFNLESDSVDCFALNHYLSGEQVFMFYGYRSNAEFLLHNGFVLKDNHNDSVAIKLGISKNDPLYKMKSEALSKLTILPSRSFKLLPMPDPVSPELLAYLRILVMERADLAPRLVGEDARELLSKLKDLDTPVSKENEMKVWDFLITRLQLLIMSYTTTKEEDAELLEGETLSEHGRMAVMLRAGEKKLLHTCGNYATERKAVADREDPARYQAQPQIDMDDLDEELDMEAERERMMRVKMQQGPWGSLAPVEPAPPPASERPAPTTSISQSQPTTEPKPADQPEEPKENPLDASNIEDLMESISCVDTEVD